MSASSIHPFQFFKWHVALWSCSSAHSVSFSSVAAFGSISIYPIPIYALNILTSVLRWVSLIIVIAGVALVGYSGSLIKDAVKAVTVVLARALGNHNDDSLMYSSAEEPELGKVLVGKFSSRHLMSKSNLNLQTPYSSRRFLYSICTNIVSLRRFFWHMLATFFRWYPINMYSTHLIAPLLNSLLKVGFHIYSTTEHTLILNIEKILGARQIFHYSYILFLNIVCSPIFRIPSCGRWLWRSFWNNLHSPICPNSSYAVH